MFESRVSQQQQDKPQFKNHPQEERKTDSLDRKFQHKPKNDKLSRCRQVEAHLDISGARSLDCPRFSWEIMFSSDLAEKHPKWRAFF